MKTKTVKRKNTDQNLLKAIRRHPGLSQYELAKKLNWSSGKVDGAVRRLLNTKQVFLQVVERNGRRVNLVHPKHNQPVNTLKIPRELYDQEGGDGKVLFYALDRSNIGVASREVPDWKEHTGFIVEGKAECRGDKVCMRIPEKLVRFYNLEEKYKTVSSQEGILIITVSGDIVETKNYPT